MQNISIIGIGNVLMGDEGFGVHVIRYLEETYKFPDNIKLVDCGTAGIYMAPFFEEADKAIVVDVAHLKDHPPGTIFSLKHHEMMGKDIQSSMSPHQIGVLEVLEICRLRDTLPSAIDFCLVVPEQIKPGVDLSDTIAPKVKEVAHLIVGNLTGQGIEITNA